MPANVTALRSAPPSPAPAPDAAAAERRALAAAINSLALAVADMTGAQVPSARLQSVIGEAAKAEAALAACRKADDARLGAWLLAGATGLRPAVSDETMAAEMGVAITARDAAAACTALPELEAAFVAAANRVRKLQTDRDAAVIAAAAAVARQRTGALAGALREVLEEHAATVGIADALLAAFGDAARRHRGDHTHRDKRDNARRFGPAAARGRPRPCPAAAGTLRA